MNRHTRREFLASSVVAAAGAAMPGGVSLMAAQAAGDRPPRAAGVTILNPRCRVPISLRIEDSTCLVNLAHFSIPRFSEIFPERYKQPWETLPREIPTAFLRKFAEWCREHGVKGQYSVIPYPACVGRLDRELPGWSRKDLEECLNLLRNDMVRDWDFHPELLTHTMAIDTKTGQPYPERSELFMENWKFSDGKSADELADYISYALQILKNVGIRCEGVSCPGSFGRKNQPALAKAVLQSCRDVFGAEIPYYVRDYEYEDKSVAPRVQYASGLDGSNPKCVVSTVICTGAWFGGWDGLAPGSVDKHITEDLKGGRLPQVFARGEPAIMDAFWPSMYMNGEERGFEILKTVVGRLREGFDNLVWMKLSEIARYGAAKELTRIDREGHSVKFTAPFACPAFTVRVTSPANVTPRLTVEGQTRELRQAARPLKLQGGNWTRDPEACIVCFDLPKGVSKVELS